MKRIIKTAALMGLIMFLVFATHMIMPTAFAASHQVLRVNFRLGATNLDPHIQSASSGNRTLTSVYDRLIVVDSKMNIKPQLATTWEASKDGLTWTFKLRKGVKFHDGTLFNADAVKFNIERVLNPATASPFMSQFALIDSIQVVDDATVNFGLKYPHAAFPRLFATPGGAIVSPAAVKKWGKDFSTHGGGAGPFKVTEFVPKDRIEVVRFDEYWQGPAKLEKIIYSFVKDDQARISALMAGSTDLEETVPGAFLPLLNKKPNIVVKRGPAMMTEYIGFNTQKAPFNDYRVRQAVGYAIDMPALIKDVMFGIGIHASQPLSPLVFGYDPSLKPFAYDPAKAKQLLAEAGWEDTDGDGILDKDGQPFKTTFNIMSLPQMVKFVEACQSYLKAVGMDVSIQMLDWGAYMGSTKTGKASIFIIGYGANTGDADVLLWAEFHSSGIPQSNRTRYTNAEYDKLCEEQRKEMNPDKRLKLIQKAIGLVVHDAPWVCTFTRENVMAHHSKVKGFQLNPSDMYMDLYSVYIEE